MDFKTLCIHGNDIKYEATGSISVQSSKQRLLRTLD